MEASARPTHRAADEQRNDEPRDQVEHVPFLPTGRGVQIALLRAHGGDAEFRGAQPQLVQREEHTVEREEAHVVVHHHVERVAADGQRQAASLHVRGEQARDAQPERDGDGPAQIDADRAAVHIGAGGKQVGQVLIARAQQRPGDDQREQIGHGRQGVVLFQAAVVEHAARVARQQDQRAHEEQRQRAVSAGRAQLHGDGAGNQAQQERDRLPPAPQPGEPPHQQIHRLRQQQREHIPRAEIPDKVLAVGQRGEEQRIGGERLAEREAAVAPQQRRTHAVDEVPGVQRHQQAARPVCEQAQRVLRVAVAQQAA